MRAARRYDETQRPGLGSEFLDEVQAAIQRIETNPESCQIIDVDEDIRPCQTRRFPYGVIDRYRDEEIVIVAISHSRRDPDHWKDRL